MKHGNAGISLFHRERNYGGNRFRIFHGGDFCPVSHSVPNGTVAEFKNIGNHVFSVFVQHAFFLAGIHHHHDFFLGNRLFGVGGINPQQAENAVG